MIWLIGSKGLIGSEFSKTLRDNKYNFVETDKEIDISNPDSLESFAQSIKTAAYFPSSLPKSERQIKWIINCSSILDTKTATENPELCEKINSIGAENIARLARKIGAKLIHISSSAVFEKNRSEACNEDTPKNPESLLGKTLLAGEVAIQKDMNQYYIFRTSTLYGKFDCEITSFIKSVLKNESVEPVHGLSFSPTNVEDLIQVILTFIDKSNNATELFGKHSAPSFGIYNYSNTGSTDSKVLLKEVKHFIKKYNKFQSNSELTEEETLKIFPENTLLSNDKVSKEINLKNPTWQKSLEKFIKTSKDFIV